MMRGSNSSVLEADLDYAERMVRSGCATPEQAAQTCGVRLSELTARLEDNPCSNPQQRKFFRELSW